MKVGDAASVIVNELEAKIPSVNEESRTQDEGREALSPELRAQLLDSNAWASILFTYAKTMKVAVALTDTKGHQIGSCQNPQPVWLLVQQALAETGGCRFCVGSAVRDSDQEVSRTGALALARDDAGLTHVSVPLFFGDQQLGTLIAGQVFDRYPEPLRLRRIAKNYMLSPQQLWDVATKQVPMSASTLSTYGELLRVFGEAFVQQRYALLLVQKLRERTQALAESNAQLERANESLQQFAYSASHDLQEPLRTVAIYGQLFAKSYKGQFDAQADEFLGYIVEAAKSMGLLVSDLLAYTRVSADPDTADVAVDANLSLQKVLGFLAASILEHDAEVTHDQLPILQMEEVHLQQLFQNLIGNALKYRKAEERPRIRISAEQKGSSWVFSVADNGIGIDPLYASQIFGIFKRLHTKEKHDGTGIGLAICKRIVERYKGRIWVESALGEGSLFRFELCAKATL